MEIVNSECWEMQWRREQKDFSLKWRISALAWRWKEAGQHVLQDTENWRGSPYLKLTRSSSRLVCSQVFCAYCMR